VIKLIYNNIYNGKTLDYIKYSHYIKPAMELVARNQTAYIKSDSLILVNNNPKIPQKAHIQRYTYNIYNKSYYPSGGLFHYNRANPIDMLNCFFADISEDYVDYNKMIKINDRLFLIR
jgi:hypothetical protein